MSRQGVFLAKALKTHQEYEVATVVICNMVTKPRG